VNHVSQIASPPGPAADCSKRLRHWHPRFVTCAVCLRPAQGFGFFNPNTLRPRKHGWFCSMPCQAWFATRQKKGLTMQGMTEDEHLAVTATMKRIALLMNEMGWQTAFADLSEAQVRALIEEAVEGFREAMADIAKSNAPEVPL
jgi:hypothetical protein